MSRYLRFASLLKLLFQVIEAAKISRPLTIERVYNSGESASGMECEAQGYPAPHIHWMKDGEPIEGRRYKVETTFVKTSCNENDYCTQTVTGSLHFTQPIQWADKVLELSFIL